MSWWAPGRRALLIEDERLFRDVIQRFLLGADPTLVLDVATTLATARTLLRSNRYDVVLLDVRLPDGSGLDLAATLSTREHAPPIVVVTGLDDRAIWARSADIGAVVVLPKASLSAERVAGALAFAFEVTASQRASELTAEAATELAQGPDPRVLEDLLCRLCGALALDGAGLTLERAADHLGIRVEVDGSAQPGTAHGSTAHGSTAHGSTAQPGSARPGTPPGGTPRPGTRVPTHVVLRSRDGWTARLELHGTERRWTPVAGALATFCDVTLSSWRFAETSDQLADSEQRCRAIADATTDLIMTFDREDRLVAANASALVALGTAPDGTPHRAPPLGATLQELLPTLPVLEVASHLAAEARRTGGPVTAVDAPVEADGLRRWYSGRALPGRSATALPHPDLVHIVLSDSTHRVLTEHELSTLALTDPLTGLANRRLAMDRLEHALDQLGRRRGALFVALLDIDYFKSINDLNGHGVGDEVIKAVARRLSALARRSDTCARLGGDEFLVVAEGVQGTEGGLLLANRIHDALSGAVTLPDRVLPVSVSLGYVIVDEPGMSAVEAVRRADEAVYAAKADGRNRVAAFEGGALLFDSGAELAQELRDAYEQGRFQLRFQPLFTAQGQVVGAEALLRLEHERFGEVTPEHFIEALLESPLVAPVGRLVVSRALEQLAAWRGAGVVGPAFRMHVNVAPHQLGDSGFVDHVLAELARAGVPPSGLALEITEQTLSDLARRSSALTRAAAAGIRLYLDGFGAGASSVASLRSATLTGIKIDRSLTGGIESQPRDATVISGLVGLGHQLGLDIVIEGVETPARLACLAGCLATWPEVRLQGFHLGRPMTPPDFVEHLRALGAHAESGTAGRIRRTLPPVTIPQARRPPGRDGTRTVDLTDGGRPAGV